MSYVRYVVCFIFIFTFHAYHFRVDRSRKNHKTKYLKHAIIK